MFVDIILDRPRKLRYDIAAFKTLEESTGLPVGAVLAQLAQFGVTALGHALWAGLKHEPGLSRRDVDKAFAMYIEHGGSVAVLMEKVIEAINGSAMFRSLKAGDEADSKNDAAPASQ